MLATFNAMMKEEWRMHSLLFGNKSFSFFPIIMVVLAFVATLLIPIYRLLLSPNQMAVIINLVYLFFGLSVGGFGFMGQEALNRRLGDISLIAYASRTLPVSERRIFANFVAKDTVFYMIFLIAPFAVAYVPARALLGLSLANAPYLLLSLVLSFLFGLALSFTVSTAYAHLGKKLLAAVFVSVFAYTLHDPAWMGFDSLARLMLPLQFYLRRSIVDAAATIGVILVMCAASLAFLKVDYRLSSRRYGNQYSSLVRKVGFGRHSAFVAKDLLDLNRSEGGLGKIVMSFGLPILAVSVMVSFFGRFLPIESHHFLLLISMMSGLVSTSLYSWLTELDFEELYLFMPVPPRYLIKSKLILYGCATAVVGSGIILGAYVLLAPPLIYLLAGFLLAGSVAAYTVAVTVYLTGLKPNVMLYSGRVFLLYLITILPPLLLPAVIFMTGIATQATSLALTGIYALLLIPASYILLKKSYVKWDSAERFQPSAN